ncbi:MAG: hypothetical protein ACRDJU_00075 [Actinomycetota bacterium]
MVDSPIDAPAGGQVDAFPQLDITLTAGQGTPAALLASLGPSPEGLVLKSPPLAAPPGWQSVSYRGVDLKAPGNWPVVDSEHAPFCENFAPDEVLAGPDDWGAVSCPPPPPTTSTAADGVWVQPGSDLGAPVQSTTPTGEAVQVFYGGPMGGPDPVLRIGYHGLTIFLGMGPQLTTAQTIFDSLHYQEGSPDTPVEGVCPSEVPTMPAPTRQVTATSFTENGTVTLDPPLPGDQATFTPQQAWAAIGKPMAGATYTMALARFTAAIPATLIKGVVVPMYQNILAWVIRWQPVQTSVGACGFTGYQAINALTGQEVN